jgi:TPP-dependent pyruvate/acetoin dehydrogenase alpha subunit
MGTKQTKKITAETMPSLISNEKLQQMYTMMLQCRILAAHVKGGSALRKQEAAAVGATIDLEPGDALVIPAHPVVAGFLKGAPLNTLLAQQSPTKQQRNAAVSAGTQSALATGIALAHNAEKSGQVAVAFLSQPVAAGDEALFFACAHKLPIVYVDISGVAQALPADVFRFPIIPVDGSDVVAVYRVAHECILRARQGGGPSLIACRAFSVNGTAANQDPLRSMEKYLSLKGLSMLNSKQRILHTFEAEIRQAIKAAGHTPADKRAAHAPQHVFTV